MEIIKPSQLLATLINRYNASPFNEVKFHFTFEQEETVFTIEFGTTKMNSSIFKEYIRNEPDLEEIKERLFQRVIDYLLTNLYLRWNTGTFVNSRDTEIVVIDNQENIMRIKTIEPTYEVIDLFGNNKSRGTFDDIFSTEKYESLEQAYEANDYVQCDFVKNQNGTLFIEIKNMKNPDKKFYHILLFQNCPAGLDMIDDEMAVNLALTMI